MRRGASKKASTLVTDKSRIDKHINRDSVGLQVNGKARIIENEELSGYGDKVPQDILAGLHHDRRHVHVIHCGYAASKLKSAR
jgi:hypothetical protein